MKKQTVTLETKPGGRDYLRHDENKNAIPVVEKRLDFVLCADLGLFRGPSLCVTGTEPRTGMHLLRPVS